MPQDAFHIRRLASELNTLLTGGKINRVSQSSKDELTFIVYTGSTTVKVLLNASASGARVCLSSVEKEPLPVPPNFCMLLRKHAQGAEILSVRQRDFERILEIELLCKNDFSESVRVLRCELMGKYSNILFTEGERILGALKTSSLEENTRRVLLAGAKYLPPAPQDKISCLDGAGMRSRIETAPKREGEELAFWLFDNVAGIALPTAREIARRAKTASVPLWELIQDFCLHEPNSPCIRYDGATPTDFFAFPVAGGIPVPSLCKAEDEYFSYKEGKKAFDDEKRKLDGAARGYKKKLQKKLQETLERLQESENADEYRLQGELLTANLYRVERGMTSVEVDDWERGDKRKIFLDASLSPSKNAQRLFKIYNKRKRAREFLLPLLEKENAELAYIDSVLTSVALSESVEDLQEIQEELTELGLLRAQKERAGGKKKKTVPFRAFEKAGVRVLAGRNNLQNDRLLRLAAPDDIWLHAQKYHSAHVIIQTQGATVTDEALSFAAELCAYFSEGRESDKVPVDYCKRKFVKKPNKSKAGFVTYTDYKTLLVRPRLPQESE